MAENPGKATIRDVLKDVHEGKYVIPHFQRGYEWEPSMVSDLLESILQDYYSGLILFWELDVDRARQELWEPVWGAGNGENPALAILDGQQRLASLYHAIYNPSRRFPNRRSYYAWFLSLDKCFNNNYEGAVYHTYSFQHRSTAYLKENKSQWIEQGVIPLAILSDEHYLSGWEFTNWLQEYVDVKREKDVIPGSVTAIQVSNLIHRLLNYQFIITTLSKQRSIYDICNIFARINQKGMRLSTFDLMNAFLYPHEITLRRWWDDWDNPVLKDIDRNMGEYILKLISLHVQDYCSSKYLYNLIPGEKTTKRSPSGQLEKKVLVRSSEEFVRLWHKALRFAEKGRKIIMNVGDSDFGAIRTKFIPNSTIIPVLGALLWECADRGTPEDFRPAVNRWYWSAVLSRDYSGSSDTVMSADFRGWKKWFDDSTEVERTKRVNWAFVENELDLAGVDRGAQYNAVLCMLALNHAEDFDTVRPLGTGDYSGKSINDHHIFPSGMKNIDHAKSKRFAECKDSILNRTFLLDETNMHKIGNKHPSVYLRELMDSGSASSVKAMRMRLEKHFISRSAFDCLLEDDFDGFIAERERTIKEHILSLIA